MQILLEVFDLWNAYISMYVNLICGLRVYIKKNMLMTVFLVLVFKPNIVLVLVFKPSENQLL